MKKSCVYISPTSEGAEKIEVLDLSSFRNVNKMNELTAKTNFPFLISQIIMSNKKIEAIDTSFLSDLYTVQLEEIHHPVETYPSTITSFQILDKHIKNKSIIGIYGDYDGDGVTSATILYETLLPFVGADNLVTDFSRVGEDGFGLSLRGVENMITKNCSLVFVLDTGSSSEETLKILSQNNIDTVVVDHHPLGEDIGLVNNVQYVDPHLYVDLTPNPEELRNAGLIWFYCRAWLESNNLDTSNHYLFPLAISALGTVADAGSQFEGIYNRALLYRGLQSDILTTVDAFKFLFKTDISTIYNDLNEENISRGFRVISLAKRTKNIYPDIVFELLSPRTTDIRREEIVKILDNKYEEFLKIADEATDEMLKRINKEDNIIVAMASPKIVPTEYIGMSGTLASRVLSRIKKPAIIFVQDEDKTLKGSWRTGEINCSQMLNEIKNINPQIIEGFGGHTMAGGILLKNAKKMLPLQFMLQQQLENIPKQNKREFFNNPNIIKHFATVIINDKDFVFSTLLHLSKLTPFNRYDLRNPNLLLTNILIHDVDKNNNVYFYDSLGNKVSILYLGDTVPQKGSVVDLLVSIRIITRNNIELLSNFHLDSDLRLDG